jgi:4-amino-4-deoxy-L-arabinose transferase-like glycosyltransferase
VRVLVVAAVADDYRPASDAFDFDRHALSLAHGDGYPPALPQFGSGPSAFRPPAYPALLAAADVATGIPGDRARWTIGLLLGALLGAATVALTGIAGRQLLGPAVGLTAAGMAALWPPFLLIGTSLLSENLFLPLMLGALAAVLRWREDPRARWLIAAGVLTGLCALTRSNGIVLLLPFAIAVLKPPIRRRALKPVAVLAGVAILVVAPWSIRSTLVVDEPVAVSTQAGYAVAGIYNDTARDDPRWPWNWGPPERDPALARQVFLKPGLTEATADKRLRSATREYVLDDPSVLARAGWWNTLRLLNLQGPGVERVTARYLGLNQDLARVAVYAFWLLLPLAVAGAFTGLARRAPWWVWLVPVLMSLSAILTAGGLTRYRLPADPFALWLAACALVALVARARARGRGRGGRLSRNPQ